MPPRVRLHRGLFEDTLPRFLADATGGGGGGGGAPLPPLALANVDCDLYSSTATVFAALVLSAGAAVTR